MKKKFTFKFMLLLCVLVVGSSAFGQTYEKVTSTTQLVAGKDYLLVNADGDNSIGNWNSSKKYYGLAGVVANADKSQITNAGSAHVLQLGGATGAWTFYDKTDSKYLSCDSDGNVVNQSSTATGDAQKWTISVTIEGVATITNNSQTARMLQYNGNNTRWACYKSNSNQADGVLYVKVTKTNPTITFSNGSVRVGRNLDLGTLFESNSEGAVTYSITDGVSYASLSGSTLTGVAEGSVTVKAEQAAAGNYNAGEATATITVNPALTLSLIAITTAPTKITYTEGETFDPAGMVVTATYSDASTENVTAYCTYSPMTALTTSDTEITVSYTENAVEKTTTQAITVNPLPKYTVTFSDGGSVTQASYGAEVTLPSRSAIGSYTFAGWSTTNVAPETTTAPTIIPAGSYTPTANITLYPVYKRTEGDEVDKTASVNIGTYATAHSWSNSTKYTSVTLDENVTATVSNGGSNTGKYYESNSSWRFYANESGELTITTSSGNLTSVTISYTGNTLTCGGNNVTSGSPVSVSGTSAKFAVSGSSSNTQITAISVDYTIDNSTTYYTSGSSYSMSISAWTTEPIGGWYLIAAPVGTTAAGCIGNLFSNSYDLYRFNQAAESEWENWKQTEVSHYHFDLEPGRGYLYANSANVTLTFLNQSTATDDSKVVTLTYSDANSNTNIHGWNLIGNPFATTATIKDSDDNDKPYYRMNADHTDLITSTTTGNVNALEGIFVHTDSGEDVTFTKTSSKRDAESNNNNIVINLNDGKGTVIDRAIVRFDEGETLPKFQLRNSSTKIYIPQNGTDYAIAAMDDNTQAFSLNIHAKTTGKYTLSLGETSDLNYVHIFDRMTGEDVDMLLEDSYSFIGSPADSEERFIVRLSYNASSTSSETFAYQSGNGIIVNGEGTLEVYDVTGRKVMTTTINGVETINGLNSGVYVFRVIGETLRTQKIVVR